MAIAAVANRGTTVSADLSTLGVISLTNPDLIAVGNTLIMTVAVDNSGSFGSITFPEVVDPRGNVWRLAAFNSATAGSANDAASVYILTAVVQRAYQAGDSLNIRFYLSNSNQGTPSPVNMDRGVINVYEFSGVARENFPEYFANGFGTGTTASLAGISPSAAGQLVVTAAGVETNAAITGDADTTDGSWVTLGNSASNSGSAATSVSLISQYKIVTGASAQNWAATWTGAADWVSTVVVLREYVAPPDQDPPVGNPNYACFAGSENLVYGDATLPVDTGTGYVAAGFLANGYVNTADLTVWSAWQEPSDKSNAIIAHDFYVDLGNYLNGFNAKPVTVTLPLRRADLSGASSVVGGGTALAALTNPGGDSYVSMDATGDGAVNLYFNTGPLAYYPSHRIVRVGLRYLAWKDDASPAFPGEGVTLRQFDTQADYGFGDIATYGSWLTPDYRVNAKIQTRWLGETNLVTRNGVNLFTGQVPQNRRYPFTPSYLQHMASGDETLFFVLQAEEGYDPLQTDVFLDYCVMVVELVPEARSMVVNRIISNISRSYEAGGSTISDNAADFGYEAEDNGMDFRSADDPALRAFVGSTGPFVVVTRQAIPASPSDRLRVAPDGSFNFTRAETFGPSPVLLGAMQSRNPAPWNYEFGRVDVVNGVLQGSGAEVIEDVLPSVGVNDPGYSLLVGPSWVAASSLIPFLLQYVEGTGPNDRSVLVEVDGTTTYDAVHLLVKNTGSPQDLELSIEQPTSTQIATASLSYADWLAAPETGDGFKEIIVPLSTPITPSAGSVFIEASSSGPPHVPWLIGGYTPTPDGSMGYGWNDPSGGAIGVGSKGAQYVLNMGLVCEMEDPDVTIGSFQVDFFRPGKCLLPSINVPTITVENAAEFDYIQIERSLNGTDWAPVGLVYNWTPIDESPFPEYTVTDYEVPWDIPAGTIQYRVTGYRDFDRRETSTTELWNGVATAPGAAFGFGSVTAGVLFVYVPTERGGGSLEVTWNPLNPMSVMQLHGVDYQIVLRAPEERGLQVSVPVVVDHLQCGPTDDWAPETIEKGSFSPTPFDVIRTLEDHAVMSLVMPGGHQRFVFVNVGGLTVTTEAGMYIAELEITDARPRNIDPWQDR